MIFINELIEEYEIEEPIIISELLLKFPNIKPNTLRQRLKRLTNKGTLNRFEDGVYYIPDPEYQNYSTLDVEDVITKKYIKDDINGIKGYITGLSFANELRLTSQNPVTIEVVTNSEKASSRMVEVAGRKVIVKQPKVEINEANYKVLQILDFITNFEKISEESVEQVKKNLLLYAEDLSITESNLNRILLNYPKKTYKRIVESGLYDELLNREEVVFD